MRATSFAWFLKDRLMKATMSGTLDLRLLGNLAKRDKALRPLLTLYVTAYLDRRQAERRLSPELLLDYGKYYDASGYPPPSVLADMPSEFRELYEAYHAYFEGKATRYHMKMRCREQLLRLIHKRGFSFRDIARAGGVNIGCVSRFLHGCNSAISEDKLEIVIQKLGGVSMIDSVQIRDYSERKLNGGIVEITFTLVMSGDVSAVLDRLCEENSVTLPGLFERFLYWLAKSQDEAREWLRERAENK